MALLRAWYGEWCNLRTVLFDGIQRGPGGLGCFRLRMFLHDLAKETRGLFKLRPRIEFLDFLIQVIQRLLKLLLRH